MGVKISQMDTAAALTGAELMELVQGGENVKGRLDRITGGAISALGYNCVFDGLTDDSANLQAAADACMTSGATLLLPAGDCLLSTTLTLDGPLTIQGSGDGTVLKPSANGIGIVLDITGTGVAVRNLKIDGSAIVTPTYTAIKVNSAGLVRLDGLFLEGGGTGIAFPQGNACEFSSLRIENFNTCIQSGGVVAVFPGDTTWRDIVAIPTASTGYGWIIDGGTNAQRCHHFVTIGGLTGVWVRGTGGSLTPDGIEFDDSSNFTQTTGPVIRITKGQNVMLGSLTVIGGSVTDCGVLIDAAAAADVDGVMLYQCENRANFKEGVRWSGGANVQIDGGSCYGNSQAGSGLWSNILVGASAKGLFQMVGVMAGASKSGSIFANIAGPSKYGVELASGALTDATGFPGRVIIVGNNLRDVTTGSISDASAPTGLNKLIMANLVDGLSNTWTPTLSFGGATTGITYSARTAIFQKVEQWVFFSLHITLSSKGSATGIASISGLPIVNGSYEGDIALNYYGNMAGLSAPGGYVDSGTDDIILTNSGAAAHQTMDDSNFTNTSEIFVTGNYGLW